MQSVISPVLLPTLRIPPPTHTHTPPSSFNGPGSQCRFPSSVPHCVTEPVKWGPCSYRDTSVMTHGAPLSGRIAPLRQLRNGARGWGGGENQQSTGPHPAPASKGPRSARHRRCQIHRIPKGDSAVIAEPGGGVAPAESGRSGPWPLGLPPERTSPSPRGPDTIQPPGPNLANRGTARSRAPRAAEGSGPLAARAGYADPSARGLSQSAELTTMSLHRPRVPVQP